VEPRLLLASPAFDLIGLTAARADPLLAGIDGGGVSIAVIDTGLDSTHPLLAPHYVAGFNFINNTGVPTDTQGHGTHVAGIIGATNPDIGVATGVGLIGLRVFPDNGGASNQTITQALQWVIDHRAQYNIVAVNMSLGSGFYTSAAQDQSSIYVSRINALEAAGVTVVAASGNSYKGHETQNSASPGIVSTLDVGAVWQDGVHTNVTWGAGATDFTTGADRVTSFSQRIDAPNMIFAPGAIILSTVPNNSYDYKGGTSMASPMVAGAVALLQDAAMTFGGRLLSADEVASFIISNAAAVFDGDDEDDNVVNTFVTYPRLDVHAALLAVRTFFVGSGGGATDANGTIDGAFRVPGPLTGRNNFASTGAIGADGAGSTVGASDVDLFRVVLSTPGTLAITVGTVTTNPADFNSYLRLFDASGSPIAFNDDGTLGTFSSLSVALAAGTYYAGVSGAPNSSYNPHTPGSGVAGATGNYALSIAFTNDDTSGTIGGAEDSDLGTLVEPFTIDANIGEDGGVPTARADVDLYRVTVSDDGTLLIDIDTPYDTDYVDAYLRVFDESGNELVVNDDGLSFDFNGVDDEYADGSLVRRVGTGAFEGHVLDSFIGGTVNRGDVYLIGVSHYQNNAYDPGDLSTRPASGPGGRYRLTITFVSNDLNGAIPQAVDDARASLPAQFNPGVIGADGLQGGGLQQVGDRDVDFIKLVPDAGGVLEITVDSYSIQGNSDPVDTVLYLFDAQGVLLGAVDDSDGSLDPHLLIRVVAGQTYYAAIAGYGNTGFDPFRLGSGTPGATGNYYFSAAVLPLSAENQYRDDTLASASVRTLSLTATEEGLIGEDGDFQTGAGDVDVYRFVAPGSGLYIFATGTIDTFSADTYLRLVDSAGHELYFNDNTDALTTASGLYAMLSAGATYYAVVSGASPAARNYDPVTGTGGAPGSVGAYTLDVIAVPSSSRGRFHTAPDAVESVAAGPSGLTLITTVSSSGRPLAFEQNATGAWLVSDLTTQSGGPPVTGDTVSWVDPKDGRNYAVAPSGSSLLLYRRGDTGWTVRDLAAENAPLGALSGSGITVFTDRAGLVHIAAIAGNGHVVLYAQTGATGAGGSFAWTYLDLSGQVSAGGLTAPVFTGPLVSYVTSWDGRNIAGLDADGHVRSIWTAAPLTTWTTSDLSAISGAPTLVGGLTTYVTSYDAVNIVGTDTTGNLVATWWLPSFGGGWVKSDLTTLFGGPKLQAPTVTSYVTPWDGTNIAGIEADGTVTVYWWAPGLGGEWQIARLSSSIAGATPITGSVRGFTSATGFINLVGGGASGHVLRYFWDPSTNIWAQENLTLIAQEG